MLYNFQLPNPAAAGPGDFSSAVIRKSQEEDCDIWDLLGPDVADGPTGDPSKQVRFEVEREIFFSDARCETQTVEIPAGAFKFDANERFVAPDNGSGPAPFEAHVRGFPGNNRSFGFIEQAGSLYEILFGALLSGPAGLQPFMVGVNPDTLEMAHATLTADAKTRFMTGGQLWTWNLNTANDDLTFEALTKVQIKKPKER